MGERKGSVGSEILLRMAFYLVLTPIGAAMRLLSIDPMHVRFDPSLRSLLVPAPDRRPRRLASWLHRRLDRSRDLAPGQAQTPETEIYPLW